MAGVDKGLSSCTLKAESQRPGTRLPGLAADARPPLGRSHCYAISFMDGGGSPFRSIAPSLVRFAQFRLQISTTFKCNSGDPPITCIPTMLRTRRCRLQTS